MKTVLQIACILLLIACGNKKEKNPTEPKTQTKQETTADPVEEIVERIEYVHQKKEFTEKGMVQFRMRLQMNDEEPISETAHIATENLAMRIDMSNGTSIYSNGKNTNISNGNDNLDDSKPVGYAKFFALPFLLDDSGSQVLSSEITTENYESFKLVLAENKVFPSASQYVVFADNRTNLLKAVAFSEGEKQLIMTFENYITVKNIPVATTWKIFEQNENGELFGKLLGEVKISQISFSTFSPEIFKTPEEAEILDEPADPPIS